MVRIAFYHPSRDRVNPSARSQYAITKETRESLNRLRESQRKLRRFSESVGPYILIHRFTSRLNFAFVIFRKPCHLNKCIGPSSNAPLADFMSFSYKFKTLGSGNSYDSRTQPTMPTNREENIGEIESAIIEDSEENSIRKSQKLVGERIKVSLWPLHEQIFALTEMLDRLI